MWLTESDPAFSSGDWHDTLLSNNDAMNVRLQTDRFTGKMVIHCHILEHEDLGMMGMLDITGVEGSTYDTSTIDPSCYTTSPTTATITGRSAKSRASLNSLSRERRSVRGDR